jgi:BON domain
VVRSRGRPEPRSRGGAARGGSRGRVPWRGVVASLLFGLTFVAGACRPINPNEDARIEAEIKARLVEEKFANLTRLGVQSTGGVVYLSGSVASTDEKGRAEVISRNVRGVTRVVNALEVQAD